LYGHSGPAKHGRPTHDIGASGNDVLCHDAKLRPPREPCNETR
jgi:hypothetical protein